MDIYIMYLRKSRSDSPDMTVAEVLQKHESILQEFALRELGHVIPEDFIYREVVSGETIADRPMMQEVMRLMEISEVKGILVVEPQRLSRGDLEDCGRIVNTFRYTSTLVLTPQKTYNIQDEYDRKFFEMELTRGNDYLEYTKKILNRGRIASVKRGNYIGSIAPYGYEKIKIKDDNGKTNCYTLRIVPEEAAVIKMMYDMYVHQNMGFANIAHALDEHGIKPRNSAYWNPAALKDMLENPVYNGKVRWNWRKTNKVLVDGEIIHMRPKLSGEVYEGKHKAIIDDVTFHAALKRRGMNIVFPDKVKCRNPYSGLVYCKCGKAMLYKPYANKEHTKSSLLCSDQVHCRTRSVSFDDFNNKVISILENTIDNFSIALNSQKNDSTDINKMYIVKLQDELDKISKRDIAQKDAFEDGVYTKEEYLMQNTKLQKRKQELTESLISAKSKKQPESINYQDRITSFKEVVEALQDEDIEPYTKNILLKKIISKIIYVNNNPAKFGNGYYENTYELEIYFCE